MDLPWPNEAVAVATPPPSSPLLATAATAGAAHRSRPVRERSRSFDSVSTTTTTASDSDAVPSHGTTGGRSSTAAPPPSPPPAARRLVQAVVAASVVLTVASACVLAVAVPHHTPGVAAVHTHPAAVGVVAALVAVQLAVVVACACCLLRHVWVLSLATAFAAYVVSTVAFAAAYTLLYLTVDGAFRGSPLVAADASTPSAAVATLVYYSVASMTLVGFGDVVATHWSTKVLTAAQVVVATGFVLAILSQAAPQFRRRQRRGRRRRHHGRDTDATDTTASPPSQLAQQPVSASASLAPAWAAACVRRPAVKAGRRALRRNVGVVAVVWLAGVVGVVAAGYPTVRWGGDATGTRPAVLAVAGVLQAALAAALCATAVKFVVKPHLLTLAFLLQFYVAAVLWFGVCYAVLLAGTSSAFYVAALATHDTLPLLAAVAEMCYFSLCTMTSVGYGDTFPTAWGPRLLVAVQMLASMLCTVGLVAFGITHLKTRSLVRRQLLRGMRHVAPHKRPTIRHDHGFQRLAQNDVATYGTAL